MTMRERVLDALSTVCDPELDEPITRLPGVRDVSVKLEDHFTGEEINAALSRGQGFTGALR